MNHRNRVTFITNGTTSIMLTFVLLCMLTFSVLSLASANANMKLAQKNVNRTTAYYHAENEANIILFQIIECLDTTAQTNNETDFFQEITKNLQKIPNITITTNHQVQYFVSVEEEFILNITLEYSYWPFSDGKRYRILAWNTQSTHEWDANTPLPLV